jgi:hypothetical protein
MTTAATGEGVGPLLSTSRKKLKPNQTIGSPVVSLLKPEAIFQKMMIVSGSPQMGEKVAFGSDVHVF